MLDVRSALNPESSRNQRFRIRYLAHKMSPGAVHIKTYTVAILSVAVAIFATAAIPFHAAPNYVLLMLAVFVSAWYVGPLAAFAAIAIGAVLSGTIFKGPPEELVIRTVLFLAASSALTLWAYREKRLQSAVELSNSRFRLLMDNVTDYAILVTAPDGIILDFNSGAKRIIGLDAADHGRSLRMIFPPDERNAFEEELSSAEQNGETRDERWHLRKDGSRFWGYGILTVLRDHDGGLKGYVKILRDLTRQKTAEDERNTMFQELENTNDVLEQMVATLAHDIRVPLTAILGWTAIRKSGQLKKESEIDHAFTVIERNAQKQLELMEGLLELYRVKSRQAEADFKTCNLSAIIYDAVETIRLAAESKKLRIDLFDCEPRILTANPTWLTQIFTNLLQNAVKFTPPRGSIHVTCQTSAASFRITISDSGIGIPHNLLPHIFVPFKRGVSDAPGAGLGLAIVRELVEKHGGSVCADSAGEGKGATFVVELPLRSHHEKRAA